MFACQHKLLGCEFVATRGEHTKHIMEDCIYEKLKGFIASQLASTSNLEKIVDIQMKEIIGLKGELAELKNDNNDLRVGLSNLQTSLKSVINKPYKP